MSLSGNLAVVATFASAVFAGNADAAEQMKFLFQGQSAFANFSSFDECTNTNIFVAASEDASRESGQRTSFSSAWISGYQYNFCEERYIADFFGQTEIPSTGFVVNGGKQLSDANLVATIPVFDFVCLCEATVSVNLRWTPTGPLVNESLKQRIKSPTTTFILNVKGTNREAVAVGTIQSSLGINFDGSSDFASISQVKGGSMTVTRP